METTVNTVVEMLPNLMAVVPMKFLPVSVTTVPTAPLVGVKLVRVGVA